MKQVHYAKIVGHVVFQPDPKDLKLKLAKVHLELISPHPQSLKRTRAVLIVGKEQLADFPLDTGLRLVIEDSQQELELKKPAKAPKDSAQTSLEDAAAPRSLLECKKPGCTAPAVDAIDGWCEDHLPKGGPELVRDPAGGRRPRARPGAAAH